MFLLCSLLKKSEFGWVEKQYLQLRVLLAVIDGKTTHFIGEMKY